MFIGKGGRAVKMGNRNIDVGIDRADLQGG